MLTSQQAPREAGRRAPALTRRQELGDVLGQAARDVGTEGRDAPGAAASGWTGVGEQVAWGVHDCACLQLLTLSCTPVLTRPCRRTHPESSSSRTTSSCCRRWRAGRRRALPEKEGSAPPWRRTPTALRAHGWTNGMGCDQGGERGHWRPRGAVLEAGTCARTRKLTLGQDLRNRQRVAAGLEAKRGRAPGAPAGGGWRRRDLGRR
jgi:hypothetical protein